LRESVVAKANSPLLLLLSVADSLAEFFFCWLQMSRKKRRKTLTRPPWPFNSHKKRTAVKPTIIIKTSSLFSKNGLGGVKQMKGEEQNTERLRRKPAASP
jgi:hypothetical protein